jgi:hypothetical protein
LDVFHRESIFDKLLFAHDTHVNDTSMAAADSLDLTSVVQRRPDLLATEMEEVTVMLNVEKNRYYGFEEVGGRIWQLLEEPRSIASICQTLTAEFEVELEQCERETLDFVRQLLAEDLVALSNGADR